MYACLFFSYILLGRILQLPRGKGHRRTLKSSKVKHSHSKDSHSTGVTLLFSNSSWVLLRPTEILTFKELWDRSSGLSSLSEMTRKSNHLEMELRRQYFILSYLMTQCWSGRRHDLQRHSSVHNQVSNWCSVDSWPIIFEINGRKPGLCMEQRILPRWLLH